MAEAIAVNVAAEAVESLISRTWREIQYLFDYKSNIRKLSEKVKDLEVKEQAVKLQLDVAERNAEVIGPDVLLWLRKVDNIKKEAYTLLELTNNSQWLCLYCNCPKLHSRFKLSKHSSRKTIEVIKLRDESQFEKIGYPTPLGQMPFASPRDFVGFESRIRIRNGVVEALRDHSINTIGICGMAGVGKTTLVKEIADKVKTLSLFDEVAMAVVSNDLVVANIQDQIAESLGLDIKEKTNRPRAERLYTRLMKRDKSILVILDDVWEELDLRNIGIPIENEREGFTILLTSRYKEVCKDMRARTFEVEVLSDEESWYLFRMVAEVSEEAHDVKDVAKEVANECGGLPLAIVTVGKALKNKEDHVWRDALLQLKEVVTSIRGMQDIVYSRIKLSYEFLENDDSKLILLLCSLFPEDCNIVLEDLVRYAKGLQLFRNAETMARVRDKVYSITDELKSCYLLLTSVEKSVKLHDVVQDVCLSIASSGDHIHMVRHDGLMKWPQEDSYASFTAISLAFDELDRLPSGLEYPKLRLLRLNFKEYHKIIVPEDFFKGMKEIKVLELINLRSEFPSSLQLLVNLRTLCLDYCVLYGDMSIIGSQKNLEVLTFYDSYLEHFPDKIAELRNLKSLDLRFTKGPPLPSGILMRLENLEELFLGSYFKHWERKGEEAYSEIITEISSLLHLQTIQFSAYDNHFLERILEKLHLEKLTRFKITKRIVSEGVGDFDFGKVLNLERINVDFLKKHAVQKLLWKTEDLKLRVNGLTNLVSELDGNGFVTLKKLSLKFCDLKYLFDASSFHTSGRGAFVNLEKLYIEAAENLEELCHGTLPLGSFGRLREVQLYEVHALRHLWGAIQHPCLSNLRILDITRCNSIKSLFLKSSSKCLHQLQRISIGYCPMLVTVVSNDEDDTKDIGDVEFPKLEILQLQELESFKSFVPESDHGAFFKKVKLANLESLEVSGAHGIRWVVDDQMPVGSLSKLRTILFSRCDGLVRVVASDSIKLLQSLQRLEVNWAKSLEVVFDFTGLNLEGAGTQNLLDRLESMELQGLPNLKHIWRMLPERIHAFRNLRSLYFFKCHNVRYLLSPSIAKMLVSLDTLEIGACKQMEAIIGMEQRVISEIECEEDVVKKKKNGEEGTNKIEFPKLKCLRLCVLVNFQMLCSENIDLELPSLTELVIDRCPKMTKFCVGRLSRRILNNVHAKFSIYGKGKMIALDEFSSWLKNCEAKIRCLDCSFWKIESCDHLD